MKPLQRKSPKATEALLPGQISYLKKRADCNEEELSKVDLSDGCFDHLVLILSTDTRTAQAQALILTSFGGKTLEERHPYNRRVRLFHLPIAPAPRHPDNGILLQLDGDLKLPKETYIKIDLPYMIPLSMLKANCRDLRSGKIFELKPPSFAKVLQYVESRLSTEPKLLRKTIASRRATHQGSRRAQAPNPPKLAPTMRTILMVFVIMIVIYVALAYLRALLGRTTHCMREIMMQYSASRFPLRLVEAG